MKSQPPTRSSTPGYTILLTFNLLLCLIAAEILDRVASIRDGTLTLLSATLLLVLLALLVWSLWKMRKSRIAFPSAELASPVSQKIVWPTLLAFTLLAASLRFYQLGAESFWYDETWTASWTDQTFSAIFETVNPLVYILTYLSLQVGRSEFVLRFAPALAGVLTVPVAYHLGRTLYGRREGLVAAFLLSISVYAIYHSQELRFYTWQVLFSALTLYFLLRGLRQNRIQDWLGFTLSTVLNLYNHPFAMLVLASEGLYVAFVLSQDIVLAKNTGTSIWSIKLRTWLRHAAWPALAAAAALVAFVPQWPLLFRFYNPTWVVGLDPTRLDPLIRPVASWLSQPVAYWIHGLFGRFTETWMQPIVLYLMLGLMLLGLICSSKRTIVLTLIWVLLPLPIVLITKAWIYDRYFSYFLPLILIVMSRAIVYLAEAFGRRNQKQDVFLLVLTVLVASSNLVQLPAYYAELQKEQWRELVAMVDAQYQPGDLVLIHHSSYDRVLVSFEWYTTTSKDDLPRKLLPEDGVLVDLAQLNDLPGYTQGYKRVWFVMYTKSPELERLILDAMDETLHRVKEWPFIDLHLLLYETKSPEGT